MIGACRLTPVKNLTFLSRIAATAVVLSTVTSSAEDVLKKEALASELVGFLHVEKALDTVFEAIPELQRQILDSYKLPPEQKDKVRQRVQARMDNLKKSLTWASIRPMYVKIYADNFDEAELEGVIAYYKSPVGQKWIEKQAVVQAAKVQVVTDIIIKVQSAASDAAKGSDNIIESTPTPTP